VVLEFFCLTCARTVYSYPGETCPVCSSPLLEVEGVMSDPELDEIVTAVEDARPSDPDREPPPESVVVEQPLD
jgi:hypothetical protein